MFDYDFDYEICAGMVADNKGRVIGFVTDIYDWANLSYIEIAWRNGVNQGIIGTRKNLVSVA